jgi:hypothetical protein
MGWEELARQTEQVGNPMAAYSRMMHDVIRGPDFAKIDELMKSITPPAQQRAEGFQNTVRTEIEQL